MSSVVIVSYIYMRLPTPRAIKFFIYYEVICAHRERERPEFRAEYAGEIPDNFFGVHYITA